MARIYDPYLDTYLKEYQQNPRSRVFAPLAEAYRKSGLVDEALEICREGLEYHPTFISGMVALARCYVDKEQYTAAIKELEKVISEVPDNYLAQKLIAQAYDLTGDRNNSIKAYKTILFLNPKDEDVARILRDLEDIGLPPKNEKNEDEIYIPPLPKEELPNFDYIQEIRIPEGVIDEPDLNFEEKNAKDAFKSMKEEETPEKILTDISTMTMGTILEEQGLKDKALEIYKKLYEKDLGQKNLKARIEMLEKEIGITSLTDEDLAKAETEVDTNAFSDEFQDEAAGSSDLIKEIFDDQWLTSPKSKIKKLEELLERVNKYRLSHAR